MSIIHPFTCGFAKVAVFSILTEIKEKKLSSDTQVAYMSRVRRRQFEKYNSTFVSENFHVDYKQFTDKFPKIVGNLRILNKRNRIIKDEILQTFSRAVWKDLSREKKQT